MSYDYDADGNKVFYEVENEPSTILDFDNWLGIHYEDLSQDYIQRNPEQFPTEEQYADLDNNGGFQSYCEEKYCTYREDNTQ